MVLFYSVYLRALLKVFTLTSLGDWLQKTKQNKNNKLDDRSSVSCHCLKLVKPPNRKIRKIQAAGINNAVIQSRAKACKMDLETNCQGQALQIPLYSLPKCPHSLQPILSVHVSKTLIFFSTWSIFSYIFLHNC